MKIINIIILISVFILGIIKMRKSSSIIRSDWFKTLSYDDKIKIVAKVKKNWKNTIFLLSIVVCAMLVLLSLFIGETHNYSGVVNILILVTSIVVAILIIMDNKSFNRDIKK